MPSKSLKDYLPTREQLKGNKLLAPVAHWLVDDGLWHITRRSASMAALVGGFCTFMPIPAQMLLAVAIVIPLRGNVPLAVAICWISNPITIPPLFYLCYKIGQLILPTDPNAPTQEFTEFTVDSLLAMGTPLLVGCFVTGIVFGCALYLTVRIVWRFKVVERWEQRKLKKRSHAATDQDSDTTSPSH